MRTLPSAWTLAPGGSALPSGITDRRGPAVATRAPSVAGRELAARAALAASASCAAAATACTAWPWQE